MLNEAFGVTANRQRFGAATKKSGQEVTEPEDGVVLDEKGNGNPQDGKRIVKDYLSLEGKKKQHLLFKGRIVLLRAKRFGYNRVG
ncbi:hypothetical protein M15_04770 [Atrimonas thermophila]